MIRKETANVHVSKDNEVNLGYLHYLANCYLDFYKRPKEFGIALGDLTGTAREHFELIADLLCYVHRPTLHSVSSDPYVALEHQIINEDILETKLVFKYNSIAIRSNFGEKEISFLNAGEQFTKTDKRYRLRPLDIDKPELMMLLNLSTTERENKWC